MTSTRQHRMITDIMLAVMLVGLCAVPHVFAADQPPIIYFFWGDGCPHCEKEKEFLAELHAQYPDIEMRWFEVWTHEEFIQLADDIRKAYNIKVSSVPITFLGDWSIVGFRSADSTGATIIEQVESCLRHGCKDVLDVLGPRALVEKIRREAAQNAPHGWEYFPTSTGSENKKEAAGAAGRQRS